MKSTTAQQIIDNDAVTMNNGDRMVDASTAYQAIEIAEQEAIERTTRWISVEDELPEEGKVVLTKVHWPVAENINYQVAAYVKQANTWITPVHTAIGIPECLDIVDAYVPTHWRPIEYKE